MTKRDKHGNCSALWYNSRKAIWTREEAARFALADRLKEWHEEGKDELLERAKVTCTIWADLLNAALSEVDWAEIAQSFLDDVDKERVGARGSSGGSLGKSSS